MAAFGASPPPPIFPPPAIIASKGAPSMNSTIAISVLVCVGVFFLFAVIKFYSVCTSSNEVETRPAARPAQRKPEYKGLDEKVVEAIPIREYQEEDGVNECAVCLGEFENGEPVKELHGCKHIFHPECIGTWLAVRHTCPICRISLLPKEEQEEGKGGDSHQEVQHAGAGGEGDVSHPPSIQLAVRSDSLNIASSVPVTAQPGAVVPGGQEEEERGLPVRSASVRLPANLLEQARAAAPHVDDEELLTIFRQARSMSERLGNADLEDAAARGAATAGDGGRLGPDSRPPGLPRSSANASFRSSRSVSSGPRSMSLPRPAWVNIDLESGANDGTPSRMAPGAKDNQGASSGGAQGPPSGDRHWSVNNTISHISSAMRWPWLSNRRSSISSADEAAAERDVEAPSPRVFDSGRRQSFQGPDNV